MNRKLGEDVITEYKRKVTFLKDIVKADETVCNCYYYRKFILIFIFLDRKVPPTSRVFSLFMQK